MEITKIQFNLRYDQDGMEHYDEFQVGRDHVSKIEHHND